MKNVDYKLLKQYKNIPRFDIGKMPSSSGYQVGQQADLSSISNTAGYDYSNNASTLRQANLGAAFLGATQVGTNIGTILNGATTVSQAAAKNISSVVDLVNKAGGSLNTMGTTITADTAANLSGAQAAQVLAEQGLSVATSGLSVAGTAAAGLGALIGTAGLIKDITGFSDRLKENDIMNSSSKLTATKYGQSYDLYGGTNVQAIKDYTSALNTGSTISMAANGAGLGSSVGSLIAPGIGTLIGGALGGIGGLIGGLFGSSSRSDKVQESINNALVAMHGANMQAESEGGSKGLRNKFATTHADNGKNITFDKGKVGDVRMVHTSEGVKPGVQFGLAGKGESIYDPTNGTASVYDEGQFRVDNIPTGVPLDRYNIGKDWNNTIIFGNKTNPVTGNTFAEDAKPYSRLLEKLNKEDMNISKHTRQVNIKNALNALNNLAGLQMYTANCGKNKFNDGKLLDSLGGATGIAGALSGIGYSLFDTLAANKENPYYPNTYRAYSGAMPTRRIVDYSQQFRNLNTANRQNIYNINNSGNISSGQRAALRAYSNMANTTALNNLYAQQDKEQRAEDNNYENALMRIGLTNQQYANQAAATQAEGYARALGAKQQLQAQARKNWFTTSRQAIQDMNTYNQYKKMLNLYDRQIEIDDYRAKHRR